MKFGQDAGYTKNLVGVWAKHLKNPYDPSHTWLPPVDHPEWGRSHDHKDVFQFLTWVVGLPDSFKQVHGVRACMEGHSYGKAPYEICESTWWEPANPLYVPPEYEEVSTKECGTCPLCQQKLVYPEVYPRSDIYYSAKLVHPVCEEKVRAELTDLSEGECHLEFGEDGTLYWVKGDYFSSSRIEFVVWDREWKLITKTRRSSDNPHADLW